MRLETYISDLLYRYDLVIIPGFGGIIGRRSPARYSAENYLFLPPHKDLSFNAQLKDNDGLLVNYISEMTNLSYDDTLQYIENEVQKWQKQLEEVKRLKLDNIGIFNLVGDAQIIFLPLTTKNYLASAYGLISFRRKPVSQKASENILKAVPTRQVSEVDTAVKNLTPQAVHKTNYTNWKYAAAIIVGLGLFTTGISWLKSQNKVAEPVFQKATFVLKKDFPAIQITNLKTPDKILNQTQYYIISGAFRDKTNAEMKKQQLQNIGFPAKIIGQNKYGLWMVASNVFESNERAHEELSIIKKQIPDAWVWSK